MTHTRLRFILICLALVASVAAARPNHAATNAAAELQGCWKLTSVEINGMSQDPLGGGEPRWVIKGDKVLYGGVEALQLVADPSTSPKIIDLKFRDPARVYEGIYVVEGDTLKVCMNAQDGAKERPDNLSTKDRPNLRLLVFQREKAAPAEPTEGLTAYVGVQLGYHDEKKMVFVDAAIKASPAEEAGIKKGDAVLKVGGEAASDLQETVRLIRQAKPGGRAAPDGDMLVGWAGGRASAEMAFFRDGLQSGSDDQIPFSMGLFALPSANGRRVFIPDVILNRDGGPVKVAELSNAYPVPAHEPGFFVALHSQGRLPAASFDKGPTANLPAVSQVAIYTEDGQRLFTLSGIEGLQAGAGLFWERRVHYYPRAGLLAVLIAPDRLLLRRVDLVKHLEATGTDYLIVMSQPPAARPGSTWDYQLDIKAKAGAVKVHLESGPEGLTVTPDGRVNWRVPDDYPSTSVAVKLTLQDASGQERLHQFNAVVVPGKQ